MDNLNFDDGLKSLTINGDESKVITFNPCDTTIINRFYETEKKINENISILDNSNYEDVLKIDKFIKEQIDYIFNANISSVVFGETSCLAVSGGKYVFQSFLETLLQYVGKELEKEGKRITKNVQAYKKQIEGLK